MHFSSQKSKSIFSKMSSSSRQCPLVHCHVELKENTREKIRRKKKRTNSSGMERSNVNELMTQCMHAGAFKMSTSHIGLSSRAFHQTHWLALVSHITLHDGAALLVIVTISRDKTCQRSLLYIPPTSCQYRCSSATRLFIRTTHKSAAQSVSLVLHYWKGESWGEEE